MLSPCYVIFYIMHYRVKVCIMYSMVNLFITYYRLKLFIMYHKVMLFIMCCKVLLFLMYYKIMCWIMYYKVMLFIMYYQVRLLSKYYRVMLFILYFIKQYNGCISKSHVYVYHQPVLAPALTAKGSPLKWPHCIDPFEERSEPASC